MMDQGASNSPYPSEQGGFAAGFSIGLLAGAAGYFLFATSEGAKLRKQLTKEWENARDYMAKEGGLPNKHISLRQFLQYFSEEVFQASLPQELMSPSKARKAPKAAARKARRESSVKFSGV